MKKTVLIDGDILLYRIATAAEEAAEFAHNVVAAWVDMEEAKNTVRSSIDEILSSTKTNEAVICLTSSTNFRKEILPSYKANRKGNRKPIAFGPLRDWVTEEYNTYERDDLEADDLLGILATHPTLIEGYKVIYSQDKDLLQIPGFHFNFDSQSVTKITKEEGDYQHYFQTLTGDRVDNYIGCPTCGPKKAEKILANNSNWNSVVSAFDKQGLSEKDALIQAQVSRILRHTDYDFNKREVKLWVPKENPITISC
jgi:DNA polymerase-1|tara:strand:+ start:1294 stop:2055 length:762 start_codon:yes stop_codon:yes gene_type:complete